MSFIRAAEAYPGTCRFAEDGSLVVRLPADCGLGSGLEAFLISSGTPRPEQRKLAPPAVSLAAGSHRLTFGASELIELTAASLMGHHLLLRTAKGRRILFRLPGIDGKDGMFICLPHRTRGEGQFAALLRREGEGTAVPPAGASLPRPGKTEREMIRSMLPGMHSIT